jgi:hypothetical protein
MAGIFDGCLSSVGVGISEGCVLAAARRDQKRAIEKG